MYGAPGLAQPRCGGPSVFANVHEDSGVVPLDWARKLRASERANRRLKSRIDQILSEY